jgi:hypothetical protein
MMLARILAFLIIIPLSAQAKEITLSEQDQTAVQQICDVAALSPNSVREIRAAIAQWCVQWEKRMKESAQESAKPPEEKK